ncbi:hypothetical protein [Janibacter melonis]|uniref:hypothetical protein n=1 Tax=Janibacter melonis TaxID=262209 RepID=UPI002094D830|nr:hypothetical protein [Janibacter melonis]
MTETRIDLDDTDTVLTERYTTLLTDLLTSSSKHVLLDEAMADLASTLSGSGASPRRISRCTGRAAQAWAPV